MIVSDGELERRAEIVWKKAESYKHYVYALEIFRKRNDQFLAEVKMAIRKTLEGKISEAELETRALASPTWKKFIDEECETLAKAGIAEMEYKAAMTAWESMRSALSSRKAEVKSFGG